MVFIGVLAILIAVILLLTLESLVVMWLWNYLSPEILPLSDMDFWQSLALVVLTSLLFGNMFRTGNSAKKSGSTDNLV